MSLAARRGWALLSGLLLCYSFPNPLALGFQPWPGWLAWVALLPLLAAIRGQEVGGALRLGYLTGLACFLPGLLWLTNVQPLGPGALPAWLALAAWCALFPGLFAALAARGRRGAWPLPVLWVPALWTLTEWLRASLLTGFPWIGLGSSQYANLALLPLAALTGLSGLHYAVAFGNVLLYSAFIEQGWMSRWRPSLAALLIAGALAWGARQQGHEQAAWDLAHAPGPGSLQVGVVQPGIDMDQAWNQGFRTQVLDTELYLSGAAVDQGAQLLLWPESAFPGFFNEGAPEAQAVKDFARKRKVRLLIGSTLSEQGYTNSAIFVDLDGNTRSYTKQHLVPFGEYVPFRRWVPVLDLALERMGLVDFRSGTQGAAFDAGGTAVVPLICYESVFPDLALRGPDPGLLAVLTVDTWYGRSAGPVWHASQAALRAVENGCWVGRAASTGISLFASPQGRITQTLGLGQAGQLVQAISAPRPTPYRHHGDWFLLLCGLTVVITGLFELFQKRKNV